MSAIDSVGGYTGEIVEAGVTVTKKSGYPQLVLRLKADRKYIETPGDIAHFKLEAPGYVDWSSFMEDTVGYFVLFNDKENFNKDTALLNYEQVQLATGWDGLSFESLADGSLIGKKVFFRVEENTYEDNTRLQVSWLDAYDAPPQRQLKSLDAAGIKALPKISIAKSNKPVAPAKPTAAPTKPGATKPSPTPAAAAAKPTTPAPAPTAPAAAAPAMTPAPAAATPAAPKTPKAPKAPKAAPPPPAAEKSVAAAAAPAECSQTEGWEYCCAHKGDNDDSVVEGAWIDACKEVGGERDEETFTPAEWAKIRDICLKDMAV
jgi:hypothetical protein